jgi:hypothetical protein
MKAEAEGQSFLVPTGGATDLPGPTKELNAVWAQLEGRARRQGCF